MTLNANTLMTLRHPLPQDANAKLVIFAFRRLGAHGMHDGIVVEAMLRTFGLGFRRPLLLLRTMMTDLAATATNPIQIAPCCCKRMTAAERDILTILARAETAPASALILLADLLSARRVDGALASVTAVARAFADAGRPIRV